MVLTRHAPQGSLSPHPGSLDPSLCTRTSRCPYRSHWPLYHCDLYLNHPSSLYSPLLPPIPQVKGSGRFPGHREHIAMTVTASEWISIHLLHPLLVFLLLNLPSGLSFALVQNLCRPKVEGSVHTHLEHHISLLFNIIADFQCLVLPSGGSNFTSLKAATMQKTSRSWGNELCVAP